MWTCVQAATGWLCSIQEISALLTMRSLFLYLLPTLSKRVWLLSNAHHPHHRCRRCRSCTRTRLRMTMSLSWCLETLSSCPPWSRAPSVRVGCTAPRWARGCPACCLKTTSTERMSLTPGSFMGEKRRLQTAYSRLSGLAKSFQFTLRQSKRWRLQRVETVFLHVFSFLALRSYSILNCASPSSAVSVGGLLFDGKLNDSLLDSLMEASSPAGLCPPMQVQQDCQPVLVFFLNSAYHYYLTGNADDCCSLFFLCQVTRTVCQPSVSKMRLFVCRHGERMDVVFGKHWVTQCFDSKG